MPKASNQPKSEPKKKATCKRSFWDLQKWKVVFIIISILFFVMFTSIMIFEAKLLENYKKAIVVTEYEQSTRYYYVYVVDSIEYIAGTGNRLANNESRTANGQRIIWYSVKDSQNYIFARKQIITTYVIADSITIAWVVIYLGCSSIDRKNKKPKTFMKVAVHVIATIMDVISG